MTKYKLLALSAMLALAGCATTSGPGAPVSDLGAAKKEPPAQAAPLAQAAPSAPAVIPSGNLSALTGSDLSSQPVAALEPPPDLWSRIRDGFKMPNLDNELVRQQEQWYATRPDYLQRMTDRSRKYLFHIVEELERRNMPTELALLPFIESAFNPQAVSSARAAGMWQFMPGTGRDFDLKQNVFRDDRRSVLESTRAALDYLQKLHGMFGDWHLALAAYNWGEGNVSRAIQRNQRAGLGIAYTDLKMPDETRNYVPKLQAVKNIIAEPEQFSADLPLINNHPYFQTVTLQRDMDVELAARLADVKLDDFKALNPQLNRPVILAAGTPEILLPWDNATVFKRNFAEHSEGKYSTWTAWTAPSTMSVAEASRRVGMGENDLRAVNSIPPRMLIKAGSVLIVPRRSGSSSDVAGHVADNAQLSLAPEIVTRRTVVKAGRRDSIASVARRYKVSPAQVAEWNHVAASAALKPGQQLVLHLPVRAVTRAQVRVPARAVVRTSTRAAAAAPVKAHGRAMPHKHGAPAKKKRR
ncbi:transglycosylase SLT domain-containing protein [Ramlibacter alkalitolerans]|uniref:Transglycosylase SLT domain-containing protein n=1 Tax=Ramlibacter alkalitolerans TaxID=2039631 RepID=A0ABS1JK76_9BURK|nr:transglycosylase SLT domain-containing protein [Ramlibacter alkalitolerans]MBL0424634.1 transglycosylase SLT domain-containing protein [Ramlibacter alkalitolerans]